MWIGILNRKKRKLNKRQRNSNCNMKFIFKLYIIDIFTIKLAICCNVGFPKTWNNFDKSVLKLAIEVIRKRRIIFPCKTTVSPQNLIPLGFLQLNSDFPSYIHYDLHKYSFKCQFNVTQQNMDKNSCISALDLTDIINAIQFTPFIVIDRIIMQQLKYFY